MIMQYLVDVIYVLIAVIVVVIFAKRGLFESVFRFGRHIAAGLISYLVGPMVSGYICSKWIYDAVVEIVSKSMGAFLANSAESFNVASIIDSLPFLVKQFVDTAMVEQEYGAFIENFDVIADDLVATVATPLSSILSNLIAYVAVYFAALLLLWVVFKVLNGVFKLPVLKTINVLLGAILGVVTAVLLLAELTWLLTFVMGLVGFDTPFAQCIASSRLFTFFGEWEIFGFLN